MSGGTCFCDDKWFPASDLESLWGPFLRPFARRKGKGRRNFSLRKTAYLYPCAGGVEVGHLTSQHTGATITHNNYSAAARAAVRGRRLELIGSARPFAGGEAATASRCPPPTVFESQGRARWRQCPTTSSSGGQGRHCALACRMPTCAGREAGRGAVADAAAEIRARACVAACPAVSRERPVGGAGASGGAS